MQRREEMCSVRGLYFSDTVQKTISAVGVIVPKVLAIDSTDLEPCETVHLRFYMIMTLNIKYNSLGRKSPFCTARNILREPNP